MGRIIDIEVERKFRALNVLPFVAQEGKHAFRCCIRQGHTRTHDRCLDSRDMLSSHEL